MNGTSGVIVGIDNGGTKNNVTVLDATGRFLVDHLVEWPSRVTEGTGPAIDALEAAFEHGLELTGIERGRVRAVGLDTPGPASADGVISSKGATNFALPEWWGFDVRSALETRLGLPVVYMNDANAAAMYAHYAHFGFTAAHRSSVSAIVGTGLGGGVVEGGDVLHGAAGMAGELGHVHIPMDGLLQEGQPVPQCNCGFTGDAESVASLTGIRKNLLPYWLIRYPFHDLAAMPIDEAAKALRTYGERGDELALKVFEQQAMALGRLFTIAANFTDPHAYFVGGGVVEAARDFRDWFLATVRANTHLPRRAVGGRRVRAGDPSRHGRRPRRRGGRSQRAPTLTGVNQGPRSLSGTGMALLRFAIEAPASEPAGSPRGGGRSERADRGMVPRSDRSPPVPLLDRPRMGRPRRRSGPDDRRSGAGHDTTRNDTVGPTARNDTARNDTAPTAARLLAVAGSATATASSARFVHARGELLAGTDLRVGTGAGTARGGEGCRCVADGRRCGHRGSQRSAGLARHGFRRGQRFRRAGRLPHRQDHQ